MKKFISISEGRYLNVRNIVKVTTTLMYPETPFIFVTFANGEKSEYKGDDAIEIMRCVHKKHKKTNND